MAKTRTEREPEVAGLGGSDLDLGLDLSCLLVETRRSLARGELSPELASLMISALNWALQTPSCEESSSATPATRSLASCACV